MPVKGRQGIPTDGMAELMREIAARIPDYPADPRGNGNIDLFGQPIVQNPDGTTSTVDSSSYNIDGMEVLLPSVTPDGRHLRTPEEVVGEYRRTGRHLGKFRTPEEATAYASQLHNEYARGRYLTRPAVSHATENQFGGRMSVLRRLLSEKAK